MACCFFITLLSAVILGTDINIIKAEFLQQMFTSKSAEYFERTTINHITTKSTLPTITESYRNNTSKPAKIPQTLISKIVSTHSTKADSTTFPFGTIVSLTAIPTSETSLVVPDSESLTKGFTIPTLTPSTEYFPTRSTRVEISTPSILKTTLLPHILQKEQEQLYLGSLDKKSSKKEYTKPETNVTVQMGNHAYLPCHIRRLMNNPVSWVRLRDGHILSVDQTIFIADQRFQSVFNGENEHSWSLQIKYTHETDDGWYECHVSTEPKTSSKVYLSVVVPKTELIGDQNRFIKAGSKVAMHCIVRGTLEPPSYIMWFRGKTQITNSNTLGWYTQIDRNIFGNSSDQQNTIGSLIIPFVRKEDSGNYTCQPSNSVPVSVNLHVLSGEYSASAIMSTASSTKHNIDCIYFIILIASLHRT